MLKFFQKKFALSENGVKDFVWAIFWGIILDISFMTPGDPQFYFFTGSR